jgi:hypothetical protein
MPGYAKKPNNNKNKSARQQPIPHNRVYYFGGNATRASISNNPGAWSSPKQAEFGVPTFGRTTGAPPQWLLDAAADKEITKGYTNKKNPTCDKCWTKKSITGKCNCE